jgi:prolyl-tRNA editing enzyme YbaK/EbsC (Cys-tRNA(Pro) deacylase)
VDNHKFKQAFHKKGRMIPFDQVETLIGHAPGGVCPFCLRDGVPVYLDVSLKDYDVVYPAAGNDRSAVRLTPEELFALSGAKGWVDVAKAPET